MSMDEDTELRDLIAQTLEENGCFAKIRAQLRASIYLALDENESVQKKEPMLNNKLKTALNTPEGRLMFQIVRDFLEYYNLNFTLSVYEPESNLRSLYDDKTNLAEDLNITNLDSTSPILLQLIKSIRSQRSTDTDNIQKNVFTVENSDKTQNITAERIKNETFDINSPMFAKEIEAQSISEDISAVNSTEKSLELDITSKSDHSGHAELEISPPIVKHSKFDVSSEKLKLSAHKLEKSKVRNLSSYDLPPIHASKSRTNEMLLPPLYTKELKDISSQKELEKMFDLEPLDNYEEDFMSESEMDFGNVKMKSFENNAVTTLEEIKNKKKVDAGNNQDGSVLNNERNSAKSDTELNMNT